MSNQLYMDESNGNGVYATKSNNTSLSGTTVTANNVSNNINVIMNAASTSAITAATTATLPTSVSSEDLSQSLSEYTDADESISAPTEFLAEFLSAVMLKDYKKGLKYCKLILQYEPNNSTAKEFYPLILEKLRGTELSDSDENYNKSSSPELQSSDPEASDEQHNNACESEPISRMDDGADEFGVSEDNSSGEPNSNYSNLSSSNCGSPEESFSVSDDEADGDVDDDVNDGDEGDEDENDDEDDNDNSSSVDDFPIDEPNCGIIVDTGRASNSSSGGEGRSRSDNTTHSYSSLLLEEEEADIVPVNLQFTKDLSVHDLDVSNGNKMPSASCSDSESPTEPLTQRLAAILRSTCGVSSATKDTK